MEVVKVLQMNGGMGDTSYANNSLVQQKVITMTKPITEDAITQLYCSTLPKSLVIADLGCSSGPNTLFVVSELIKVVNQLRQKLGHRSPEYQVFLNDLPRNDFNAIFKSLPRFQKKMSSQLGAGAGPCFFVGVPGSFYSRLFPSKTLHFVDSSYSLQWLSKVPKQLESNKGNIYMARTSQPSVPRAYHAQFQQDFSMFLKCRAEERSEDPSSRECCYIWELLAIVLNEMVSEGLIDDEKMDSFNIPQYTPSPSEVKYEVLKEGSFFIDCLEVSEVNWSVNNNDGGYNVAQCMRAVAEPLLVSHFGEAIIEEVFSRYREILSDRFSKKNTHFVNVIVP
ncbi:hypothetical protein CIPAW_07G048600 [Carya illinoinensis]|uniref:Uncharacterized protein n=1 Tax=Carya illinoinensis TaxID=32201 RepID=A0A8T1PS67_CARIL|nr:hypothetical protein CIPAW_07G048600 [Carya illinoinensis]KAG6702710.1 hypothetical protein I3842_07G049000 [Carya illinoinensis]